ncbi:MAG: symmetrical bis(5'-nucleosyl)-tetraphosphatase [Deltaproteobacteria bacterium]|nr:symmetrical bis(5'-nucleosyl)-tetraphosphatase [Deltaproteobacteria bacterium]
MATYAIGDVQGCFGMLKRLLERIEFDPARDRVLLVGDLVNRGPQSAEVLRWAMRNDKSVRAVLGNHDLYLISRALGVTGRKKRDTLDGVLDARDRGDMIDWLRTRPLAFRQNGHLVVHAGILPAWTADEAEHLAGEAEEMLQSRDAARLLTSLGEPARKWRDDLAGLARIVTIVQVLTRMRTCRKDGVPNLEFSGPPEAAPAGCRPWFDVPGRKEKDVTVVFGHWAALGLHLADRAIGLDTGAVWGNKLTAIRLDDRALFQEAAK